MSNGAKALIKLSRKIKRKLGIKEQYASETSKVRSLVLPYCNRKGGDIGFGGDKIKKEDCLGIDFAQPYAYTGKDKVDIACNIENEEIDLPDNTLDYVYSSHLIEDFKDTVTILRRMIRVLKSGGNLIIVFPDQPAYEKYCRQTGQPLNLYHVHATMGLDFMRNRLNEITEVKTEELFSSNCKIDYNVILVVKIYK